MRFVVFLLFLAIGGQGSANFKEFEFTYDELTGVKFKAMLHGLTITDIDG